MQTFEKINKILEASSQEKANLEEAAALLIQTVLPNVEPSFFNDSLISALAKCIEAAKEPSVGALSLEILESAERAVSLKEPLKRIGRLVSMCSLTQEMQKTVGG